MNEETVMNVYNRIQQIAEMLPNNISLQVKEEAGHIRHITYKELIKKCHHYANRLTEIGIPSHSTIVLLTESIPEAVISLLAVFAIDCTAVILDPSLPKDILANLITEVNPVALLSSNKQLEKIELAEHQRIPILLLEQGLEFYQQGTHQLPSESRVSPDDTAVIIFTSGTTGNYRGVMLSHSSLLYQMKAVVTALKAKPQDIIFIALPFNHIAPLAGMLSTLSVGARLHFVKKLESQEIFSQLSEVKPTVFPTVPRILEMVTKTINKKISELPPRKNKIVNLLADLNFFLRRTCHINLGKILFKKIHQTFGGHLHYFLVGSAPLKIEVHKRLLQFGFNLFYGYGLTEITNISTLTKWGDLRFQTVGKPLEGTQIKIDKPNETGVGEILISSPGLMQGYFNDEKATQEVLKNHWLYTGDLGYFDKKGYLYITGRSKEVIVTQGGKKAPPVDIESQYGEIEGVEEFTVFGVPVSEQSYDVIYAAVLVDPEYKKRHKKAEELIKEQFNKLSQKLPHQFRIQKFHFTDFIPKTSTLKVKRAELRNIVLAKLKSAKSALSELSTKKTKKLKKKEKNTALKHFIRKTIIELSPEKMTENFDDKQSFFELGMDSLMAAELCQQLQMHFNNEIVLPVSIVTDYPTVENLANVVADMMENKEKYISQLLPPLQKMSTHLINPVSLQQQYWLERQMKTDLRTGYISLCLSLNGKVDFERFKKALHHVGQQQDILRTTFLMKDDKFFQKVNKEINFTIAFADLSHEVDEETAIRHYCNEALAVKCDYENGPLGSCHLLQLTYCRSVLLMAFHHLIFDGMSIWVLLGQLSHAYEQPELAEAENPSIIQYADFALWQQHAYKEPVLAAYKQYWASTLLNSKPFTFPHDHANNEYHSYTIPYYLPCLKENVNNFVGKYHGTEFCVYYLAFLLTAAALCQQYDTTVSVPQSGRFDPQLNNLIGFFSSTCLSRVQLTKSDTIISAFVKLDKHLRELMRFYIPYQLVKTLTQDNQVNTDYDILFSYMKSTVNGTPLLTYHLDKVYETSQPFNHDMMWYLLEYSEQITLYCVYNQAKYERSTVIHYLDYYTYALSQLLVMPDMTVEALVDLIKQREK